MNNEQSFDAKNYLKEELYALVKNDPLVFDFLQEAILDGIWYWDLENPTHEWMSSKFWTTFGYDPSDKKHLASEWQEMIHPQDLTVAQKNVQKHIKDPSYPYDQIVRYKHKEGHYVWVRCRGLALYDHNGNATRLIGAHTNITGIMNKQQELVREQLSNRERVKDLDIQKFALQELEQRYSFLEYKLSTLDVKDEITHLYSLEGFYNVTSSLVLSAIRLDIPVNLFSLRVVNHEYIKNNIAEAEVKAKLATLQKIIVSEYNDMELAFVSGGFIFGLSIGYSQEDALNKMQNIKEEIKTYNWSIVKPEISVKTCTKDSLDEYSFKVLENWIVELG